MADTNVYYFFHSSQWHLENQYLGLIGEAGTAVVHSTLHMKIAIGLNPLSTNTLTSVTFVMLSSFSLIHLLLVPGNVVLSRNMYHAHVRQKNFLLRTCE